jgi:hypothetical protein
MTKKEKEGISNIYTKKKLLSFPTKVNNNNNKIKIPTKNYELYNIVSENGDSIYSPQYEEVIKLDGGQMYIAEDKIREIVKDELAKYFNGVNFNKNES